MLESKKLNEKTLHRMHMIYCKHNNHKVRLDNNGLCQSCQNLLNYSLLKTSKCKHKEKGRLCSSCKNHCFSHEKRSQIRQLMRFSGPRLFLSNPILSIRYLILKVKQN